jgi:hypothetical protein
MNDFREYDRQFHRQKNEICWDDEKVLQTNEELLGNEDIDRLFEKMMEQ